MNIHDLRKTDTRRITIHYRGCTIEAHLTGKVLAINFQRDGENEGRVMFEPEELPIFIELLSAFFPKHNQGRAFNYNTRMQRSTTLPQLQTETCNWGEPYSQGVRFTFSKNFDDYSLENLYFMIEASEAERLLTFLESA